jgi:hypothetical protein
VYYLPHIPIILQNTLPSILLTFPYFRCILLREQIDIVHAHGVCISFSFLFFSFYTTRHDTTHTRHDTTRHTLTYDTA